MGCKLFVSNLPANATGAELQKVFANYGVVKWADVAIDTATSRCKGFGFVQMSSEQEASRATNGLSGRPFQGKRIVVSESKKAGATPAAKPVSKPTPPEPQRRRLATGRSHHRSPRRG